MPFVVNRWERRDAADRDALERAALRWSRAVADRTGVRHVHVYWSGTEHVVSVVEVESYAAFDRPPSTTEIAAELHLADLARPLETERWVELRDAAELHVVHDVPDSGAITLREALDMP